MKHIIDMAALYLLAAFPTATIRNDGGMVDKLKAKLLDLNQAAVDIQNAADAEQRELTDDEQQNIDSILNEFKHVEADIERRERLMRDSARLAESTGRQSAPAEPHNQGSRERKEIKIYREPIDHKAKGQNGFNSFGEFAKSVRMAARNGGQVDPRLIQNAPTTVSTEGTNADGGFAVPPTFRAEIERLVMGEDSLLSMTDQLRTGTNNMTLPKDATTPWQSTGGIQSAWTNELAQMAQSKVALGSDTITLDKLTTLLPVTEELLDDAAGLDSYIRSKVPEKMDFKITDAIVNGTGTGQPEGFMNSAALITVAKEAAQAADTVKFENIIKMWARMYGPCKRNAVWLINQDIEPQLYTMSFEGTSSSVPAYMPAGGLSDSPYGRLMGRPVIETQAAQTLGDAGDIMLVDLSKYLTLRKTEGLRADTSMHLWFDYDTLAYRFIIRLTGKSWYDAAITPKNSANTLSPFVTLAARA